MLKSLPCPLVKQNIYIVYFSPCALIIINVFNQKKMWKRNLNEVKIWRVTRKKIIWNGECHVPSTFSKRCVWNLDNFEIHFFPFEFHILCIKLWNGAKIDSLMGYLKIKDKITACDRSKAKKSFFFFIRQTKFYVCITFCWNY